MPSNTNNIVTFTRYYFIISEKYSTVGFLFQKSDHCFTKRSFIVSVISESDFGENSAIKKSKLLLNSSVSLLYTLTSLVLNVDRRSAIPKKKAAISIFVSELRPEFSEITEIREKPL